MTIREAQPNDLPQLLDILVRSFATVAERFGLTRQNCPKNLAFCTAERLSGDIARGLRFYLAEDDGTPCGCVAMEHPQPDVAYLERLAVLPAHRSKGFGQMLVRHVQAQAKAAGAGRLEIGIIAEDAELKQWYERFGFELVRTQKFEHLPFVVAFMAAEL